MYTEIRKGESALKLIKKQVDGLSEIEVEVRYSELNAEATELIRRIEQGGKYIFGIDNGRQYKIRIGDVYYIESVDKKTFVYTKESVFRSELRLYQLFDKVKTFDFVQVSKSCLINMNTLKSIHTIMNSRLEATLINNERVMVSRTYLANIKEMFTEQEEHE